MTINDLITKIKEKSLTKDQIEDYHAQMSHLYAEMQLEMADLEKAEAIWLDSYNTLVVNDKDKSVSVAQKKIEWKATKEGQRLIVLKRYCLATKTLLRSLQSRLYSVY